VSRVCSRGLADMFPSSSVYPTTPSGSRRTTHPANNTEFTLVNNCQSCLVASQK